MGCGCGKRGLRSAGPPTVESPDPTGAIIAAARAGGAWRLTTAGGTIYAFPSLAQARDAQRAYGGTVSQTT